VPAAGVTKFPSKVIAKTVERYKKGERVVALAKELKVSEAIVYRWIDQAKRADLERIGRQGMTPQAVEKADKRDLALQVKELKAENNKLRNRVLELMLKYGEL
jgi:transposase-like protein